MKLLILEKSLTSALNIPADSFHFLKTKVNDMITFSCIMSQKLILLM